MTILRHLRGVFLPANWGGGGEVVLTCGVNVPFIPGWVRN